MDGALRTYTLGRREKEALRGSRGSLAARLVKGWEAVNRTNDAGDVLYRVFVKLIDSP